MSDKILSGFDFAGQGVKKVSELFVRHYFFSSNVTESV